MVHKLWVQMSANYLVTQTWHTIQISALSLSLAIFGLPFRDPGFIRYISLLYNNTAWVLCLILCSITAPYNKFITNVIENSVHPFEGIIFNIGRYTRRHVYRLRFLDRAHCFHCPAICNIKILIKSNVSYTYNSEKSVVSECNYKKYTMWNYNKWVESFTQHFNIDKLSFSGMNTAPSCAI